MKKKPKKKGFFNKLFFSTDEVKDALFGDLARNNSNNNNIERESQFGKILHNIDTIEKDNPRNQRNQRIPKNPVRNVRQRQDNVQTDQKQLKIPPNSAFGIGEKNRPSPDSIGIDLLLENSTYSRGTDSVKGSTIALSDLENPSTPPSGFFDSIRLSKPLDIEVGEKDEIGKIPKALKKYSNSGYINSVFQLMNTSYFHMSEDDREEFSSSDFPKRLAFLFGNKVSPEEIFPLIENLTGLTDSKMANDGSPFLTRLFSFFEGKSLNPYSFRNLLENVVDGNSRYLRKRNCFVPFMKIPSMSMEFKFVQHGIDYFLKYVGLPEKKFEFIPNFVIIQSSFEHLNDDFGKQMVYIPFFSGGSFYSVVGITIRKKSQYTAIVKDKIGNIFHCDNDEFLKIENFSSVPYESIHLVLLKKELEKKKVEKSDENIDENVIQNNKVVVEDITSYVVVNSNPTVSVTKQPKPKPEPVVLEEKKKILKERKGGKLFELEVVQKQDNRKMYLRFQENNYAIVNEVEKCTVCKSLLKYVSVCETDTKYVECVNCNQVFCWICKLDTPFCRRKYFDFDGKCEMERKEL